MGSKMQHPSSRISEHPKKVQALAQLERRDAAFRHTNLYRALVEESNPSITLDEVFRITSKIPGSLAAEVIAEREKGRG